MPKQQPDQRLRSHEESAAERQLRLAERAKAAQALRVTKGQMKTLAQARERSRQQQQDADLSSEPKDDLYSVLRKGDRLVRAYRHLLTHHRAGIPPAERFWKEYEVSKADWERLLREHDFVGK